MDPVDVLAANAYTDAKVAGGGGGGGTAGVSSFKGRTGAVTPATGDYTADMVGADASGSATAAQQAANLYTDAQIAAATGALSIPTKTSQLDNDSGFATSTEVDAGLETKVDKESGKVLSTNDFTTAEKEKLAALENYNDTEVKQLIDGKVDKEAGKGLSTNDYTTEEKQRLATLQNYDDTPIKQQIEGKVDKVEGMGLSHNDLTDELVEKINAVGKSMQLKTRVDTGADLPTDPAVGDTYFVGLEGATEFEQYTYTEGGWLNTGTTSADLAKYLLKDEATALLAGKVDKVEGKSLSTNDYTTAEKEKLDGLTNYDDSGIRADLAKKVDAVAGKVLSSNDYTTAEKEKLSTLTNYDDTAIRALLAGKVDAVEGKSLSTNDYTNEEKAKVDATAKIDDATTSETSVWSSSKVDSAKQDNLQVNSFADYPNGGSLDTLTKSGVYSIGDPTLWTDLPTGTYGVLVVLSGYYKTQIYLSTKQRKFFYYRFYDGNAWSEWAQTTTQTTADVAVTPITALASGVTQIVLSGSGNSHYQVINGICYFQVYVTVQEAADAYFDAITGLPKPKTNTFFAAAPFANADTFTTIRVNISTGGIMRLSHGVVGGMYMITGSYPVA